MNLIYILYFKGGYYNTKDQVPLFKQHSQIILVRILI